MLYSDLYANSLKVFANQNKTLEIQVLIEAAFNLSRAEYWIKKNEPITDLAALRTFYRYRNRLLKDEPIAYMLKKKEFYGEVFFINKSVLIPRPETEILVEKALELIEKPIQILDIGAGSGIIGILLAKRTGSGVTAVERSKEAIYVLKKNIVLHGVGDRVIPVCRDFFSMRSGKFDMIVSNPPYVSEGEWGELEVTVRDYEPKAALVGGKDGTGVIRGIVEGVSGFLKPGGWLLMEIGYNQEERVHGFLKRAGFREIAFYEDYSHIPRVAVGKMK